MKESRDYSDDELIDFNYPSAAPHIIKAIGVGGGGGNAVTHMYQSGISGVSFALCNTDNQALKASSVPVKVLLGNSGLGAGTDPNRGKLEAEKSIDSLKKMLSDGTKMVFLTAGMGGGTGTGASPVIAKVARDMGILTVGIVTLPFLFEGRKKIDQALDGIEVLAQQVDAMMVINNERLREIYQDLTLINAFAKADDILTQAAQSIVDIIGTPGKWNVDFQDVQTTLRNGGVSIISTGYGEGEHRLAKAIENALASPLLNENDIYNSKKIILNIYTSDNEDGTLGVDELDDIDLFMSRFKEEYESKPGFTIDSTLGKKVKVSILASGFGIYDKNSTKEEKDLIEFSLKEEEREARRNRYYGERRTKKGKRPKKRHHVFLFNNDEALDNNDLIEAVEKSAVYNRSGEALHRLKEKQ